MVVSSKQHICSASLPILTSFSKCKLNKMSFWKLPINQKWNYGSSIWWESLPWQGSSCRESMFLRLLLSGSRRRVGTLSKQEKADFIWSKVILEMAKPQQGRALWEITNSSNCSFMRWSQYTFVPYLVITFGQFDVLKQFLLCLLQNISVHSSTHYSFFFSVRAFRAIKSTHPLWAAVWIGIPQGLISETFYISANL